MASRVELRSIIENELLKEGFFDTVSNLFKSEKTKAAEAERIKESDRQIVREHFQEFDVIKKFYMVAQNWHSNNVFACEDINGKKTLWYQSSREKIMVQIAGVGFHPYPPGDPYAPGSSWIVKSTPLKRPYGGSIEEKVYQVLNTYQNGFDSRDALSESGIVNKISVNNLNRNYLRDLFRSEIVKSQHDTGRFNVLFYQGDVRGLNATSPIGIINSAIQITTMINKDNIDGSNHVLVALEKLLQIHSSSDDEATKYEASADIYHELVSKLGYNSMTASTFDSSWADELYESNILTRQLRKMILESIRKRL